MVDPVTIGFGCNKWVKDSNTRMVTLMIDFATTTAGDMSFTENKNKQTGNLATNSRYVVPTGKKLVVLLIKFSSNNDRIGYSTTVNDGTNMNENGTNIFFKMGSGTQAFKQDNEVYIEIPAGNYLHSSHQDTGGSGVHAITIVGVETTV
jgi:hypothetical protein